MPNIKVGPYTINPQNVTYCDANPKTGEVTVHFMGDTRPLVLNPDQSASFQKVFTDPIDPDKETKATAAKSKPA